MLKFQNQSGVVFKCFVILVEEIYRINQEQDSIQQLPLMTVSCCKHPSQIPAQAVGELCKDFGHPDVVTRDSHLTFRLGCSKISPSQFQTEDRPGIS